MSMGLNAMLAKSVAYMAAMRGGNSPFPREETAEDASETVYVQPLPLLKILAHARRGVPFEVMGILLGKLVDQYTLIVTDVFPMPQVASTVAVDALDPAFQVEMKTMLEEVGRLEEFVGWYHSHPGYGCWLSSTDRETQAGFQAIENRAVAIVIDPVQSVRGRVVLESFRVMDASGPSSILSLLAPTKRPRHITSFIGLTDSKGPDYRKQLTRGLTQHYYKLNTTYQLSSVDNVPTLSAISNGMRLTKDAHDQTLKTRRRLLDPAAQISRLAKLTKAFERKISKDIAPVKEAEGKAKKKVEGEEETAAFAEFGKEDTRARMLSISRGLIDTNLLSGLRTGIFVGCFNHAASTNNSDKVSTPTSQLLSV